MQIAGLANSHPKVTARALSFPFVGRMQYAPTLTVEKTGSFFEPVCFQGSYFSSEWVGAQKHTPLQTFPSRERTWFFCCVVGWFIGDYPGTMVPDCGAYAIRPYPDGQKNRIIFEPLHFPRYPDGQKKGTYTFSELP